MIGCFQYCGSLFRPGLNAIIFAVLLLLSAPAFAGCAPGLPCNVPLTPNDPVNPGDGPNIPGAPNADRGTGAGSACDADFMNQIYSRAWLESQRDVIKSRILIRKPDSVMEYSCFSQFSDIAGERIAPIFSESTAWAGVGVSPAPALPPLTPPGGLIPGDDGSMTSPNGTIIGPDGTITTPDGTTISPDKTITAPDGTIIGSDGAITMPDGTIVAPDKMITLPDGTIISPDTRTITLPDGTITPVTGNEAVTLPDGTIINPDEGVILPGGTNIKRNDLITLPNGTIIAADGAILLPDRTFIMPDNTIAISDGTIINPDGTAINPDSQSNMMLGTINWMPVIVTLNIYMGPDRMSTMLQNLVQRSTAQYITDNFSHRFLGGAANTPNEYQTRSGVGGYNCTYMNQVYFLAKCTDMVTDDRFWKFSELIGTDPRLLPAMCTNGGTKITQAHIDLAENKDRLYVSFDKADPTYRNLLARPGTPGFEECAPPLLTGLIVTQETRSVDIFGNVRITNTKEFPDMVCPNPDCSYNGSECIPP